MKLTRYLFGLASGLAFGMLFAPKKGRELRKEILSKGSGMEGLKTLGNAFKGAGEEVVHELGQLREHKEVAALLEIPKEKLAQFLEAAKERGYDASAFVQEKLGALSRLADQKSEELKKQAAKLQKKTHQKSEEAQEVAEKMTKKAGKKVRKWVEKLKGAEE